MRERSLFQFRLEVQRSKWDVFPKVVENDWMIQIQVEKQVNQLDTLVAKENCSDRCSNSSLHRNIFPPLPLFFFWLFLSHYLTIPVQKRLFRRGVVKPSPREPQIS